MNRIRLSYSAMEKFLSCERMFQLDRLLEGAPEKRDYPATVFGKAFGAGVSSYLIRQDPEAAIYAAWLAYYPILEDDKRTEEILINLLVIAFAKMDDLLLDWEVASFKGKPSVETSFCLNISEKFYFVGYIDVILKNRWNGRYAILENKTTGLGLFDLDPLYKNSGQALGYSIVLDKIAGYERSEYDVLYLIGKLNSKTSGGFSPTVITSLYPKTLQDRLNWFIGLKMDVERLDRMLEMNVFPQRGGSCLQYMRPCHHFGICGLQGLDKYKKIPEDLTEYDFTYDLDTLIEAHLL